jgi:cobalt-zinc-cadmium efflux system membrane fusion protein
MKHILAYPLLLLAVGLTTRCSEKPEAPPTETANENFIPVTDEQQKLAGITFGPITEELVEQTISCSGIVDVPPANRFSMTTVFGGYITYTGVYPGDKVSKGQLLARLQDPLFIDLQRSYLEGLSKLDFLETDYQRKTELLKTESVSAKQYQEAKRDLETVKIEVNALAAQLKMAGFSTEQIRKNGVQPEVDVRSPINGFVTEVNVNQGMHMQQGQVLFLLIDPTHMHIELSVFPNDLEKLKEGERVYFRVAGDTEMRQGTIKLINKSVTADTRSILVHVHPLEKDEDGLLPGTFIQAKIVVGENKRMVLPMAGVNQTENTFIAYKKVEGGVEAVYFSPQFTTDKYVDGATLEAGNYVLIGAEKLLSLEEEDGHGH